MDLLSDVFERLRLRGGLYFTTDFAGGWGVRLAPEEAVIRFHLVVQGECWVEVEGSGETAHLHSGEFVLVPHGAGQTLLGAKGAYATPLETLVSATPPTDAVLRYRAPSRGSECRLVCGFCHFDPHSSHPLLVGLPSMIVLTTPAIGASPWLADAIRLTTVEANRGAQGSSAVVSRLIEILLMQAICALPSSGLDNPFIRAASDPPLATALTAIHEDLQGEWTLTSLARAAGMSRTQFARRFKHVLHQTPMQYLTSWRLTAARGWLRDTDLAVVEIAQRSGYHSVPSFTRRFKKRFGITPGAYRRAGSR